MKYKLLTKKMNTKNNAKTAFFCKKKEILRHLSQHKKNFALLINWNILFVAIYYIIYVKIQKKRVLCRVCAF